MLKYLFLIASFSLFSSSALANSEDYSVDFGLIFKNEMGEPVGFYKTQEIPLQLSDEQSLYGLVVSRNNNQPFLLSVVHVFPHASNGVSKKVLSKAMSVSAKGAIFFQTTPKDVSGDYAIEVYIDNILMHVVNYQLVNDISLEDTTKFSKDTLQQSWD